MKTNSSIEYKFTKITITELGNERAFHVTLKSRSNSIEYETSGTSYFQAIIDAKKLIDRLQPTVGGGVFDQ